MFDQAFAPLAPTSEYPHGQGVRIAFFGDSGCGKTTGEKAFVAEWLRRMPRGFALVQDDTGPQQFKGQTYGFPSEIARRPLAAEPRIAVFRGRDGVRVDPEDVAVLGWNSVTQRRPTPVLVVFEELDGACIAGNWIHGGACPGGVKCTCKKNILFAWGRRSCASVMYTLRSPQDGPRAALEQLNAVVAVHLGGLGLDCLQRRDFIQKGDGAAEALRALPGAKAVKMGAPVRYLYLERGIPWNRRYYSL